MNKYIINCSEEQTKRALELGAPIINYPLVSSPYGIPKFEKNGMAYIIPTAEEMIGWLEEQADILDITVEPYEDDGYPSLCGYGFYIRNKNKEYILGTFTEKGDMVYICPIDGTYCHYGKLTKREAILVAIDAALEYISLKQTSNKQE